MSTQFTEHAIEILDDWNDVLSGRCCCTMPACPVPTRECESIYAVASAAGFFDPSETDPDTRKLYSKHFIANKSYTYSEYSEATAGSGYVYPSRVGSGSGSYQYIGEFVAVADGLKNAKTSVTGCHFSQPAETYYCAGSSSWTTTTYEYYSQSDGIAPDPDVEGHRITYQTNQSISYVGGGDNGEGGVYGPCQFIWSGTADYYSGGVLDHSDPVGPFLVDDTQPVVSDGLTTENNPGYENGVTFDEWLIAVRGFLEPKMDFADDDCGPSIGGNVCISRFQSAGQHSTYEAIVLEKARFRWVVPQDWSPDMAQPGTYFKITWDIIEEPDGWDAPSPTVFRSFVATDQTWEWTGPGDPEDPDTWKSGWYEIEPPSIPGERRVVNIRFECYRNSPYGVKPQVTGEAVTIEELADEPEGGNPGVQGTAGRSLNLGRLGRTGGLRTGRLVIGGLRTGGLRTGGLRTGGLRSDSLRTGGLTTGGLRTGGLRSGGLRTGGLRTSSL